MAIRTVNGINYVVKIEDDTDSSYFDYDDIVLEENLRDPRRHAKRPSDVKIRGDRYNDARWLDFAATVKWAREDLGAHVDPETVDLQHVMKVINVNEPGMMRLVTTARGAHYELDRKRLAEVLTPKSHAAIAAWQGIGRYMSYLRQEWGFVGVVVHPEDDPSEKRSVWGIEAESESDAYLDEVAEELIEELEHERMKRESAQAEREASMQAMLSSSTV
jgi:hypothetical protein